MDSEASVKVLRAIDELEEIREVWESWPGHRDSEMESYTNFVRTNPGTVRPHVLVVYRGGRPDAVLVGRIDQGKIHCRLGYLGMAFGARIMCFVYGALRGNPCAENCELLVNEILRSLSRGEADVAYLNFLKRGSDLCRLATKKPGLLCRDYIRVTQPHFALALPGTVEGFYGALSYVSRQKTRQKQRKLVKDFGGKVRIHCFHDVAELEDLIQDVEQVAKKSYQRGLGVGFMDSPETRQQLRFMAERGWLHGYVLYIAEHPSAFWIGNVNRMTFGSDYTGYDPQLERYSPGMYLITKVIEGLCDGNRGGVTEVDFGLGHAQWKEVLSNREWQEDLVYIFAPSPKGISLNLVRSFIVGMDQAVKKAMAHTSLLKKIKKRWRSHVTPNEATHG